jgi:hypothetical protein
MDIQQSGLNGETRATLGLVIDLSDIFAHNAETD